MGLLGGSFNPAHEGHRHISLLALKHLDLDEVWWLVSPQNPLKPAADMADLEARLAQARARTRHPRIKASAVERALGTRYTVDTLRALRRRLPRLAFVWLMGADNFAQLPRWRDWAEIFRLAPIAVFDRPSYSYSVLTSKAAQRFAGARLREARARSVAQSAPPAWVFIHERLNPESATRLRAERRRAGRASRERRQTTE